MRRAAAISAVAVMIAATNMAAIGAAAQEPAEDDASAPTEAQTEAPAEAQEETQDNASTSEDRPLTEKAVEAAEKAAEKAGEITDAVVEQVKAAVGKARAAADRGEDESTTADASGQATREAPAEKITSPTIAEDAEPEAIPAAAAGPAPAIDVPVINVKVSPEVEADYAANLEALFKHFHANPELSFREFETAARLAEEFRALGYEVTEKVGQTGVVAVLTNGEGPTVMLRADMDGLPVEEKSGLAYASKATQEDIDGEVKPVMHACGHDVHITALVGAARQLAARKDEWNGTLVLIAQPAEERIDGARAMLEDGLYERFPKPDYALAFHVAANRPAGKIEIRDTLVFSSSDSVNVTVRGIGAHGAGPHKGVDPILVASHIVVALQSVVSRNINPLQPGVITVGSFHGGFKHNIIPDQVDLELTVRSNDREVRDQLIAGIERTAEGVARGLGVPDDLLPIVEYGFESTPTTVNDAPTAQLVRAAFEETFGADQLVNLPAEGMGAEDFAYFVQPELGVKGVYFRVGGTAEQDLEAAAGHHSPLFKILPEPSVKIGVEAMTTGAIALFGAPAGQSESGD